jgi:hypothetical protein
MKSIRRAMCIGMAVAAAWAAEPVQLDGRIVGKQGVRNARQWTIEVRNSGSDAVRGARIGAVHFTQTSMGGGEACAPAIRTPAAFPLALGDIPAGGTARASLTIDFTGCANQAQFTVEMHFSGNGGAARGTLRRSNDYR